MLDVARTAVKRVAGKGEAGSPPVGAFTAISHVSPLGVIFLLAVFEELVGCGVEVEVFTEAS
jgi:hypothetical protein